MTAINVAPPLARDTHGLAMSAADLAYALGGRKCGSVWVARCPAHKDRTPSLSISDADDGKILVRCHAGCEQAIVIAALRVRRLWSANDRCQSKIIDPKSSRFLRDGAGADRTAAALKIWRSAAPATNSAVTDYLQYRGIDITPPNCLRFHPELRHPSGGVWPAMIALVSGSDNKPVAIHRTFLARSGTGKAPVVPTKMMLGPCHGGVVRLGTVDPKNLLVVAEGVETALSVMQACGLPGWAALSANGIRSLTLPPEASTVLICADNDANGVGQRAANEAAERFLREGRQARIAMPPMTGTDFNNVLNGGEKDAIVETRDVA